ncbi:MAG: nicotinate (nicotinamide) nucleotide adenylyltransferase [Rickettsiales bacterium]|jgi:nicotinate-nucleotide adenylyltransferase|nr:nicotinate (nicotinamide) nucleotide adenylyltransferase [Rickettsiales bacterium]
MLKIGILGGSFNPPHQGHLNISNLAIKKLQLNQLWWIPTKYNTLKDINIYQSYETRVNLCIKITNNNSKIIVKPYPEIHSYKLINYLQKKYPQIQFIWVMGADSLFNLHHWNQFRKILEMIDIAVFSRDNLLNKIHKSKSFIIAKKRFYNQKIKIIRIRETNISSTMIRKSIKNNLIS